MAKQIIVAGAGASGLMAAITAARGGAKVTILEAMDRPGKKLLMTGNGRCNLTNTDPRLAEAYHGADASFVIPAIHQFDAERTRSFFQELGLLTIEKNGYVYPCTNQASSVLAVLLTEVRRLGIRLKLTEKIEAIQKENGLWHVRTATWTYQADSLILSCGSKCAPGSGSDGSGYVLARMAGLKQKPVAPALVPLICGDTFLPKLAGIRCHARITLFQDRSAARASDSVKAPSSRASGSGNAKNQKNAEKVGREWRMLGSETGEIQWTKYGISGIAVFQLSRFVSLSEDGAFRAVLDLLNPFAPEEVAAQLERRAALLPGENVSSLLQGLLHEKLIPVILERAGISQKNRCRDLSPEGIRKLLQVCTNFSLTVLGTKGFDVCQVCAGGVDTAQLVPETMECRQIAGLYVTGELLDIDGPCGGYNLQWAWSSGYAAGKHAAEKLTDGRLNNNF